MAESKHYNTRVSEIWIDREEIMHVVFARGVELQLEDMEEAYTIFRELGIGPGKRKSLQLLSGGPFNISKKAKDYAGSNGTEYFIAAALVTQNTAMRYVINLFNLVIKHNVPFSVFSTEEDAIMWLNTFRK